MKKILLILAVLLFVVSCSEEQEQVSELDKEIQMIKDNTKKPEPEIQKPQQPRYTEGTDYVTLEVPYDTENASQVIIYEFFGYTCPHCFHFEPTMNEWLKKKPSVAKLIRVPLNFHPSWAVYQQGFLTAESMGVAEIAHNKLFSEIHENHRNFTDIEQLAEWYAENTGINKDEFLSTADSFILDSKLRKADNMGFRMQITGTPSVVVNGKYKVQNNSKDQRHTIGVINYLIAKEATEMGLIK